MKKWLLSAAVMVVVVGALFASSLPRISSAAQSCEDWGEDTLDRVAIARQLVYPRERQEQTTGSARGDAQALYDLAEEQGNSNPPDEAYNLNGDLVEAYFAASNALLGGGSSESQMAFAKAIIYNADLRLAYFLDGC
jgi:hypothetical protein